MTIILSRQEHRDIINSAQEAESQQTGELERYINYPGQLGHAYYYDIEFRPGFQLGIKDRYFSQPLTIKQPEREHPIELSFCLSGKQGDSAFGLESSGGSRLFGNGICPQGDLTFFPNQQILKVDLHLEPDVLEGLLCQGCRLRHETIETLLRDRSEWLYFMSGKTTPGMELVLRQIVNCPYRDYIKRLYLESKALELITLQLEELFNSQDPSFVPLNQGNDRACIFYAREILDKYLPQAPTLTELAREVGLNERKLKEGFQQIFQTTPFEYLRDRRLEQAQQLLLETNQSVQEVAYAVGYRSRSQFANAFRQKFGVNPKCYQRTGRDRDQLIPRGDRK